MDREHAVRLLRECYGWNPGNPMPGKDREFLELHTPPHLTILDTLQGIAGDRYNWRDEPSWHERARHFASVV